MASNRVHIPWANVPPHGMARVGPARESSGGVERHLLCRPPMQSRSAGPHRQRGVRDSVDVRLGAHHRGLVRAAADRGILHGAEGQLREWGAQAVGV